MFQNRRRCHLHNSILHLPSQVHRHKWWKKLSGNLLGPFPPVRYDVISHVLSPLFLICQHGKILHKRPSREISREKNLRRPIRFFDGQKHTMNFTWVIAGEAKEFFLFQLWKMALRVTILFLSTNKPQVFRTAKRSSGFNYQTKGPCYVSALAQVHCSFKKKVTLQWSTSDNPRRDKSTSISIIVKSGFVLRQETFIFL